MLGEKFRGGHIECLSKAVDDVQGWVALAPFDPRDIGAIEVRTMRKILLRPPKFDPEFTHARPKFHAVGRDRHIATLTLC